MSDYVEKASEFKNKFLDLLQEYDVGLYGTMHFRIGDQELLLDTTGAACAPGDCPENCDEHETCGE